MLSIRKQGNPVLKEVADEVPQGANVNDLISTMFLTMRLSNGVGLAANQVGELKRVIVIENGGFSHAIINPVITKRFGGKGISREGCLSYPGKVVKMKRYKQVTIEGFDQDWNPIRFKLKSFNAYIAQHEVDHLNGVTIA